MAQAPKICETIMWKYSGGAQRAERHRTVIRVTRECRSPRLRSPALKIIDLLMGLFRGAVFRHGGGALKQPIKKPTETPTSTLALMGRFPSWMGRFPTLMGRLTDFVLRGRFASWKSTGEQPIKKRGIKRFLRKLPEYDFDNAWHHNENILAELSFTLHAPDLTPQNKWRCSYIRNSWPAFFCDALH